VPRVVIVDDHPFVRRGIQSILKAFPQWELCGEADNGGDAIRLAAEMNPELVIMDISMPGINGIEAARTIHQKNPGTKIILLTLHDSPELVRSAFRAGVQGYLLKIDAERELVKAMKIVLDDGAYISPKVEIDIVKSVVHEMSEMQTRRAKTSVHL
jgi:DNA-binding NarL/FixJ family response regulator